MANRHKHRSLVHSVRNTFIPHRHNGGHPHVFRWQAAGVIALLAVLIGSIPFAESALKTGSLQFASVLPGAVVALTNEQRAGSDLSDLTENSLLDEAAQNVAEDMATKGYFAHVNPSGKTPWDWLDEVGYDYQFAGENLALNVDDSQQVVNAWMASPTHRANILDSNFTEIGVGTATGTYQGGPAVFVVQFFGSPMPESAQATVVQSSQQPGSPQRGELSANNSPTSGTVVPAYVSDEPVAAPVTSPTETPEQNSVAEPVDAESSAQGKPQTSAVLGTATASTQEQTWWQEFNSNPAPYVADILIALGLFMAVIFGVGYFSFPLSRRTMHPKAVLVAIMLLIIVGGTAMLDRAVFVGHVMLPGGSQAAAVGLTGR